ncbi:MAG: PD-(D/E)XK nuclease family protein [Bacteroidaceae bacterium]|nr:PD-(D/E)XK nuclease family protein [Bacteroidaceae bacterium]
MNTFLEIVAKDLYERVGTDLSHTAVVFPNKRASLFFSEYLARQATTPVWSPAYISIQELFASLSPWKTDDPIRLVCELYKVYCEETQSSETLDDFYYWGELLISDFNDVDKNMADARQLFSNLQELKDMEDLSYLTEEQQEAIRQFFSHFSIDKTSELKQRFMAVWNRLGNIYERFRQQLAELGIAYEGMLYRDVIERFDAAVLPYDRFAFVGFNVLNRVETLLFSKLQEANKALFYWDYDTSYTTEPKQYTIPYIHEAGEFIIRNMKLFPNALGEEHFHKMQEQKQIKYIASPTENAQARYIPQWYAQLSKDCADKYNAVVLCNERLLQPVLHALPEEVKHVNVTMGFPLSQTPVYSFINVLADLQTIGYDNQQGHYTYDTVLAFLRHPYTKRLSQAATTVENELTSKNRFFPLPSELKADNFLDKAFTPVDSNLALCTYIVNMLLEATALFRVEEKQHDIFAQLYRESLFKSYTIVNRLLALIQQGDLNVTTHTCRMLLKRILSKATIPFHGEPAIGLQVMGVLETRNLDFQNLLLLSVNEGQLPKSEGNASFIPYNLRKAFGLTTIEHENSLYAYYFYRLIQRAKTVTLMYNTSTEGLNRGEMSRFMLQLLTESPHNIIKEQLESGQSPMHEREITIEKTPEIWQLLLYNYANPQKSEWYISPSALNTYLNCPVAFYFKYVARIRKLDEVSPEINNADFGNIFHKSAEQLYRELTAHGKIINQSDLEAIMKNKPKLHSYVDNAFKDLFFKIPANEQVAYNGTQQINRSVIIRYLENLIRFDLRHVPFTLEEVEKVVTETLLLPTADGTIPVNIGGTIDRMDSRDGVLRIIDYKTGGKPPIVSNMDDIFASKKHDHRIFQTFMYASIMCRKQPLKVSPGLLLIHRAASNDFSTDIIFNKQCVTDFSLIDEEFRERLQGLLTELFDRQIPFKQTENRPEACKYCDYRQLCKIKKNDYE